MSELPPEFQEPSSDSIDRLYTVLETLSEKPPEDIDIDMSANLFNSQTAMFEWFKSLFTGQKDTFYAVKGKDKRPAQILHISLVPKTMQFGDFPIGYLATTELEDIDGEYIPKETRYHIYKARVSKHLRYHTREEQEEDVFEQAEIEQEEERMGFAKMSDSEVNALTNQLTELLV